MSPDQDPFARFPLKRGSILKIFDQHACMSRLKKSSQNFSTEINEHSVTVITRCHTADQRALTLRQLKHWHVFSLGRKLGLSRST